MTITNHLILLNEAGLLRCEPIKSSTSDRVIYVIPFDLTWDGHEFLDTVRSDNVWGRLQNVIASKGGALAFGVVSQLATRFAMEMVKDA